MLDFARSNDNVLLCFHPHTTKHLHLFVRTFFQPLKEYYSRECNFWFVANKGCNITQLQFGLILGKAATNENAVPGFKATVICPLDGNYIPEFAFSVSDAIKPLHSISRTEWDAVLSTGTLRSVILHQSSMPSSTNIPQPSASSSIILPLSCKSLCSSNMSKSSGEMNCLPPLTPIQHSQEEVQTEILIELSPPPKLSNSGPSRIKRSLTGRSTLLHRTLRR